VGVCGCERGPATLVLHPSKNGVSGKTPYREVEGPPDLKLHAQRWEWHPPDEVGGHAAELTRGERCSSLSLPAGEGATPIASQSTAGRCILPAVFFYATKPIRRAGSWCHPTRLTPDARRRTGLHAPASTRLGRRRDPGAGDRCGAGRRSAPPVTGAHAADLPAEPWTPLPTGRTSAATNDEQHVPAVPAAAAGPYA
jgi:hypothetical protein